VGLFYAIALGMVSLLGAALALFGARFFATEAVPVFQLVVAFLYMPMPLVAGLIVERVSGRPASIRNTLAEVRRGWKRILGISVVASAAVYLLNIGLTAVLGMALGIGGFGRLVFTQAGLIDAMSVLLAPAAVAEMTSAGLPPVPLLYVLGLVSGLAAGFTINGLFAFGEEYGWRGVLMDELMPLGAARANLLTGVMWGLWHAPLILLGFNYGADRYMGILMMCIWVTPFSFLMWRAREYSGSVLAPAIIHGAFNGSAGFFLFLVAQKSTLLGAPAGVIGALSTAAVAAVVWRFTTPLAQVAAADPIVGG
jgi:membrane protease YdiL (CAAX protease family)